MSTRRRYELGLVDDALDPLGELGRRARPARLGQQRADDVLLLRRRARGAAGVRPRRAARAATVRAAARWPGSAGWRCAVAIYLAFNAGRPSAHGWGVAMSTDTAFALGMLALVGPRFPDRLRAFMLTVVVVDDIVALRRDCDRVLGVAARRTAARRASCSSPSCSSCTGSACASASSTSRSASRAWVALLKAGVEPVVIGLAMGLLASRTPAPRSTLERATERFREFREQPTPELARSAGAQLRAATPPNERLQQLFHPWTSYVIVPLFALANAGHRDRRRLPRSRASPRRSRSGSSSATSSASRSAIFGSSWLVTRLSARAAAAAGGLGRGRRRRHDRRHRLHRLAARRDPRLRRDAARGGEARHSQRRSRRRVVTWLLFRATALLRAARASAPCSAPPSR